MIITNRRYITPARGAPPLTYGKQNNNRGLQSVTGQGVLAELQEPGEGWVHQSFSTGWCLIYSEYGFRRFIQRKDVSVFGLPGVHGMLGTIPASSV